MITTNSNVLHLSVIQKNDLPVQIYLMNTEAFDLKVCMIMTEIIRYCDIRFI